MTLTAISRTVSTLSVGMPMHWRALTLYPLYRHDEVDVDVMPASEALRSGALHFSEAAQATVPMLTAVNHASSAVVLVAGEVVFGGRQDRMVTDSLLVPPGEWGIPVPVWSRGVGEATPGSNSASGWVRAKSAEGPSSAAVKNRSTKAPCGRR